MTVKIDSNLTGLAYAPEETLGVLPVSPTWTQVEPNSYSQFGGLTKLTKRNPITPSRMTRKGVVTDLDVNADFQVDLTMKSMYDLMQGFLLAPWVTRVHVSPTAVSLTSTDHYVATSTNFLPGNLVLASGFGATSNNGLKAVTAVTTGVITCAGQSLAAEASPPATAKLKVVGFKFTSGDLTAALTSSIPTLACTTADFTTSFPGLAAGDWLYIGGDEAGSAFTSVPAVNGWARVATVGANLITFDKVSGTWSTDAGTGQTVQVFYGDRLHNQYDPANQVRTTYQWERSLASAGWEYVVGATPNEVTFTMATSNKITVDMKFLGIDNQVVDFGIGAKSGTRVVQASADALNTTSDFSRLSVLDVSGAPVPGSSLTTFLMDATVVLTNNASATKALTRLGAIDINLGDIEVSGKCTAYFTDNTVMKAAKDNRNVSMDFALVRNNAGMLIDLPQISLSDARLNVVKDKPIEVPLTMDGAQHDGLLYLMMLQNFDYLPSAAA